MGLSPGFDAVVVGAGVVGLAAAAELARAGRSVLILERRAGIGQEATSRNSQVIHAGLYYPPGSLKADLCCRGRELLYAWVEARGVPHRKLGKLVVASDKAELTQLEALIARGQANGVPGLRMLGARDTQLREPALAVAGALYSPETGILDAARFALSLLAEAEAQGATLLLNHEVIGLARGSGGWQVVVRTAGGEDAESLACEAVINAGGLASDSLAQAAGIDIDARGYRQRPCKGNYFALQASAGLRLSHLVYPVPPSPSESEAGGLGIHATLDLDGGLRFGPDAHYVEKIDFGVDPAAAGRFASAVRRYLPEIREDQLVADFAGVRSKLAGPGEGFRDFVVQEETDAGAPGLINCIGIESPGLTASLAIGERVAALLQGRVR